MENANSLDLSGICLAVIGDENGKTLEGFAMGTYELEGNNSFRV